LIKTAGLLALTNSLTVGADIYLGVDGALTNTAPTDSGSLIQKLGRVLSSSQILFSVASGETVA
jgi:hypothetical protein